MMAGAAWAFDAEYTASQTVTISEAGSYLVTGTGGGAITIAADAKTKTYRCAYCEVKAE